MKKTTQERVADLNKSAGSQEDFMRQLAMLETGEISQEALAKIDGGKDILTVGGSLFPGTVYGMYIPPRDIFDFKTSSL